MKKLFIGSALIAAVILVAVSLSTRWPAPQPAQNPAAGESATVPRATPRQELAIVSRPEPAAPVHEAAPVAVAPTVIAPAIIPPAANASPGGKPKKELKDPAAHVALSLVGVDPAAEEYWAEAIFDSSLPDREREDLMEDLNETGLSDPKHPSPEDMVVIANRIRRIEDVLPYADEFMVGHLAEAYKDLVNLLNRLPVQ